MRGARLAALVLLAAVRPVAAQRLDTRVCEANGSAALCRAAASLAEVLTARGPSIAAAGSPVTGTASTLGTRVPGVPRISIDARWVRGSASVPTDLDIGGSTPLTAWTGDIAIGVLDGLSPMSTVGGLFSLDLLGSVGVIRLSAQDGFADRSPVTWAVGGRLGILRESFTLPGVSLSVMRRHTGRASFGDAGLAGRDEYVVVDGVGTWSLRAVTGKRLGVFGFNGGFGWDRSSGRGRYVVRTTGAGAASFDFDGLRARRTLLFAGASWTTLVFNLSAEIGRQSGTAGATGAAADGGWFYGVAARVTF